MIVVVVCILTLWAYGIMDVEIKIWEVVAIMLTFIGFGALGFYDDFKKLVNGHDGFLV